MYIYGVSKETLISGVPLGHVLFPRRFMYFIKSLYQTYEVSIVIAILVMKNRDEDRIV